MGTQVTSSGGRQKWKLRLLFVLAALAILFVAYVGSFFVLRKHASVTFFLNGAPMNPRGFYSIHMFFYSRDSRLNHAAFVLYYPLHRQGAGTLRDFEDAVFGRVNAEQLAREKVRYVYLDDVEFCYQAQFAGFRRD